MTLDSWFQRFWEDDQVAWLLVLIAADIALGVLAAIKVGNFRLSYLVDFLRNDVLFKVVPFFVVYGAMLATDGRDVIGPIDFGDISGSLFVGIVAALAASIFGSLRELQKAPSQPQPLMLALAGPENSSPPKD